MVLGQQRESSMRVLIALLVTDLYTAVSFDSLDIGVRIFNSHKGTTELYDINFKLIRLGVKKVWQQTDYKVIL